MKPMEIIRKCSKQTAEVLSSASYLESHFQSVLTHLLKKEGLTVNREYVVNYRLPDGFCLRGRRRAPAPPGARAPG